MGYTEAFVVSLLSSVAAVISLSLIKEGQAKEPEAEIEMSGIEAKENGNHPEAAKEEAERLNPSQDDDDDDCSPAVRKPESKFKTCLATFRSDLQSGVACFCQERKDSRHLRSILLLVGLAWMIEDACNVKYEHLYPYLRLLMGPSLIDYGYYRAFLGSIGSAALSKIATIRAQIG